jgi:apolipoprotein N-acyltransferase
VIELGKTCWLQQGSFNQTRMGKKVDSSPLGASLFRTFATALLGLAGLWLAFPPVGWWWLAWVAPVPMVWLIAAERFPTQPTELEQSPDGADFRLGTNGPLRMHYWMLYLAGLAYWLGTFYFIPLPHPLLWFGWLAISLYLAIYTPMFVGVARILVHRYRLPVGLAVPVVGSGLEWFRSVFLTGMPMVCLSHTQFRRPELIQIADLCGAYTLTFAMLATSAGLGVASLRFATRWLAPNRNPNKSSLGSWARKDPPRHLGVLHLAVSGLIVLGVWGYGQIRLHVPVKQRSETLKVALIQSSIDVVFAQLSEQEQRERDWQYWELTQDALRRWPELDLVVWPESSFPIHDLLSDYGGENSYSQADSAAEIASFWKTLDRKNLSLMVGGTTLDPKQDALFASSILIAPPGRIVGRYFKNHRVMFGEYVPLADQIPLLQKTPLGKGVKAGDTFEAFEVKGLRFAPCICFESTVPHLVRRMVRTLSHQQQTPDVLVNQTNDGWFFGSSCLDLHLACNVFRAVEMRKPMLVCANTGFSAVIDPWGRLQQTGPRRQAGILQATVNPVNGLSSPYLILGDGLVSMLGFGSILVLAFELRFARRAKKSSVSGLSGPPNQGNQN